MFLRLLTSSLIFLVLTCSISCKRQVLAWDPLFHIDPDELAALVNSDSEANHIFQKIKAAADEALKLVPTPVDTIFYEGLIDADPKRVKTKECLLDAPRAENLAWAYLVTRKIEYAEKAREIILAWSRTHIPLGNPISEKELIPMITAYGLLISNFKDKERSEVDFWLEKMALLQMLEEKNNNWQAKRLWLVGYIGLILQEQEFIDFMKAGYERYVDQAFYADGKTNDFIQRDAFHYHCSGLWPLIELAVASDRNGINLAGYENPDGGSLKKCIDFMVPYTNGEKQHEEFVDSKVKFDRIRAEAGESEYARKIFDGKRAAKVYEYYSYFENSYLPLAFQIKKLEVERFSTWKTVLNHVLVAEGITRGSAHNINDYPHPETNPSSRIMLSGDWVPENTHDIDFMNLPQVPVEHVIVSDVRDEGGTHVNQHNYLVYYHDKFWLMWSDGPGVQRTDPENHRNRVPGHDRAGQIVSYAYSKDGKSWSQPSDLTGPPAVGFGWIARGFWIREGKLLALATHFNAPDYRGEGLALFAFELETGDAPKWKSLGLLYDNAMNNFPPKLLPNGEWMMTRRDSAGDVHILTGGVTSFKDWRSVPLAEYNDPTLAAEEPYWWLLPDNNLVGLFRDNHKSGFLYRSFSTDFGLTWTTPVRTNLPDATSKFNGLWLSEGRFVLVSNPNPEKRDPLAISISDDGLVFSKMIYLVGGRHVDYPHVMEHEDYLYIAFAGAKQTVELLKIKISDL